MFVVVFNTQKMFMRNFDISCELPPCKNLTCLASVFRYLALPNWELNTYMFISDVLIPPDRVQTKHHPQCGKSINNSSLSVVGGCSNAN
jgi:hypothetical protein